MRFRIVDAALLVATIAGGCMAVSTARKLHGLQREDARLTGAIGELPVTDPAQLHIQAIDTGEPLHYAWHVYAPAGKMTLFVFDNGGSNVSQMFDSNLKPRECIGHIRFMEQPDGKAGAFCSFRSDSFCSLGSPELFRFLREHWRELEVEQLGAAEVARLKSGRSASLLRVSLTPNLVEEARKKKLYFRPSRGVAPPLFECRLVWK